MDYMKFRPSYEDRRNRFVAARKTYTFHLLGLVHLPVSRVYSACAYTQKIRNMAKMLLSLGHEVYIYGAESGDAPCTEYVVTHTMQDIQDQWGEGFDDPLGYDWKTTGWRHDFGHWKKADIREKMHKNAIVEINKRKKPDHFILNPQGKYFEPVTDEVGLYLTCEPGIGYTNAVSPFCAFESGYMQYNTYGSQTPHECLMGLPYDRVIPNYYVSEDFPLQEEKDDFFFYIGRIVPEKGVETAVQICEYMGAKLKIAGQLEFGRPDYFDSPVVDFVGYADPDLRAELMGRAKAALVPTSYLEPFGGVNVEAQMCGTPVLASNFGAFPETVINGVTGWLCSTMKDYCIAAGRLDELAPPRVIHELSQRYSTDSVRFEFQKWFDDLYEVYESSINPKLKGWHRLP